MDIFKYGFNELRELIYLPENDRNDRLLKKQIRKCGDGYFITCYTNPKFRDLVGEDKWYQLFFNEIGDYIDNKERYIRVMEDFRKVKYVSYIRKPTQSGFSVIRKTLKGEADYGLSLGDTMNKRYWNMTRQLHPRSEEHVWINGMFEELKKDINYKGGLGGRFYFQLQGVDYGY